jgi:hypothetical protein
MNRWYILAPAFLSALALVLFSDAPGATAEVVSAVQGPASPAPAVRQAGSAPAVSLPRLLDRQSLFPASSTPDVRSDLFAGRDWSPLPSPKHRRFHSNTSEKSAKPVPGKSSWRRMNRRSS